MCRSGEDACEIEVASIVRGGFGKDDVDVRTRVGVDRRCNRCDGISHAGESYEIKAKGEGGNRAMKVIGGAGLSALIGGLAGAAGGTAIAASKKGQQLQIPSETLLEFRLEQPVASAGGG